MSARPEPPLTPKSAGTRRSLLDLAARLFVERGYAAVSLRDIADEAGLTKGAIYGHFRSKGQLLVEVLRHRLRESDGSVVDDPASLLDRCIAPADHDLRLLQIDATAAARHDPDVAQGMAEIHTTRTRRLMGALDGTSDPATLAFVVEALSAGVGAQEAHGRPVPDPRQWRRVVARMLGAP